ncbi:periplasmic nitrate reductase, NapE protein [Zooshikella ganghwensis]|uniref:Periplasmic nitrate reductase, NapE protein n=1 Tax=Zooshikella ganghwensis TaxID=202772 RepID=A0A4P9VIV7_9GAMM|nr:periplasmic nitrate reductase, NapE protein [Zooshikella ganghwensis]RDH42399.1 periplasmic nitrate reductase, NapE protein [Zooshikella ganghwensis]
MSDSTNKQKHEELLLFLFLTVVLAPLLSIIFVGGFGFIVWISQILTGPPGPPG